MELPKKKGILGASSLSFIRRLSLGENLSEIFVFMHFKRLEAMLICIVVHVSDCGFLYPIVIQFSSVPDLPVSAGSFLCI